MILPYFPSTNPHRSAFQSMNLLLSTLILFYSFEFSGKSQSIICHLDLWTNFSHLVGLLIGRGEKSHLGTNSQKNRLISQEFCRKFQGKLCQKAISKKWPILWLFSRQISLEINRFCADQTSVFKVFLIEVIIYSFNNNTLKK